MCHYAKGQLLFIVCLSEQEASHNSNTIHIIHPPLSLKKASPAFHSPTHTLHFTISPHAVTAQNESYKSCPIFFCHSFHLSGLI